jgi:two-component system, cell cycle sensor histidine kinase and response regulator CckA
MNSIRQEQEIVQDSGLVTEKLMGLAPSMILVVEDEDFVREVTCEVLLSAGYVVLRARTAAEAVRLFPRNGEGLQLLLTDVVLPGRSGQALAEELRAISPGLKTIFISGYPEVQISTQGLHEAGTFYLPKPFLGGNVTGHSRCRIGRTGAENG